jgi:hypothetical protein
VKGAPSLRFPAAADLCRLLPHNIPVVDLPAKWEVMYMNSSKASQPNLLAEFELTLKHTATERQKTGDSRSSVTDART